MHIWLAARFCNNSLQNLALLAGGFGIALESDGKTLNESIW